MRLAVKRRFYLADRVVQVGAIVDVADRLGRELIAIGKAEPASDPVEKPEDEAPAKPRRGRQPKAMSVASAPALVPGAPDVTDSTEPAPEPIPAAADAEAAPERTAP